MWDCSIILNWNSAYVRYLLWLFLSFSSSSSSNRINNNKRLNTVRSHRMCLLNWMLCSSDAFALNTTIGPLFLCFIRTRYIGMSRCRPSLSLPSHDTRARFPLLYVYQLCRVLIYSHSHSTHTYHTIQLSSISFCAHRWCPTIRMRFVGIGKHITFYMYKKKSAYRRRRARKTTSHESIFFFQFLLSFSVLRTISAAPFFFFASSSALAIYLCPTLLLLFRY